MFKKGQLVKIVETGKFVVIVAFHSESNIYFAKYLTGPYLTVLYAYAQDMELIGNNFKFKGAK